jgi:hypothetical protein
MLVAACLSEQQKTTSQNSTVREFAQSFYSPHKKKKRNTPKGVGHFVKNEETTCHSPRGKSRRQGKNNLDYT